MHVSSLPEALIKICKRLRLKTQGFNKNISNIEIENLRKIANKKRGVTCMFVLTSKYFKD